MVRGSTGCTRECVCVCVFVQLLFFLRCSSRSNAGFFSTVQLLGSAPWFSWLQVRLH